MVFKKGIYQGFGFKKGNIPWNKNKKGVMPIPWNKGFCNSSVNKNREDWTKFFQEKIGGLI